LKFTKPKDGVEAGPNLLLRAGLLDQLELLGWKVNCPDSLPCYEHLAPEEEDRSHPVLKNVQFVSKVTQKVQKLMKNVLKKGHFALTLGGDHSIGMATVSAALAVYPDLGVIWVDAHAVFYF
jgi:arginase